MQTVKENIDYVYVYPENSQAFIDIKLISGEYSGTIYRYGVVGVEEGDDKAFLKFEYDIISSPINIKKLKTKQFENYIGNILANIISGGIDETGTDYLEEFDL